MEASSAMSNEMYASYYAGSTDHTIVDPAEDSLAESVTG